MQRYNQAAKIYLERSIQLDPSVTALARLLTDHPENFDLANPIRESIDDAIENINHRTIIQANSDSGPGISIALLEELKSWLHFGRIFQESYTLSTEPFSSCP